MIKDNRDSLDFGTMNVFKLYGKILFPTLFGMVASVANTIIDGIFVGQGVGSDAIAAVNIIAPLFMIVTGLSLMFGVGASVVASVHMSQGRIKAANINITQAFIVSSILMVLLSVSLMLFCSQIASFMGSSQRLMPFAIDYLMYLTPGFLFLLIAGIGLFVIKMDGSPKYAMMCSVIPSLINIILDYIFIFPMSLGVKGAAMATSIGTFVGGMMVIVYMIWFSNTVKWYRLKLTAKSLWLTVRNIGYQIKLGSSAMIGEVAVSVMMATGNYVFMRMLGEDGVAAFSVACYSYPIVFMINTAVAMSAQPIISYNFGLDNIRRVNRAVRLMIATGLICGSIATVGISLFASEVASLFLTIGSPAHEIAVAGLPVFSIGFIFFAFNITCIGYYQSTKKAKAANFYAVLRGIMLPVAIFLTLPSLLGVTGIWLSVPIADIITTMALGIFFIMRKILSPKHSESFANEIVITR